MFAFLALSVVVFIHFLLESLEAVKFVNKSKLWNCGIPGILGILSERKSLGLRRQIALTEMQVSNSFSFAFMNGTPQQRIPPKERALSPHRPSKLRTPNKGDRLAIA